VSTVRIFNDELKDFGISSILIVMDRGFTAVITLNSSTISML